MKHLIPFLPLFFIACTVNKIIIPTDVKLESFNDTIADKYASTILKEDLLKHLSILASDEYEGRETAKPGQKKAAKYISEKFIEFGVQAGAENNSYMQTFKVDVKNALNVKLAINNKELVLIKDFYYIGDLKDVVYKNCEIINIEYGIEESEYSNYLDKNVKGKFLLIKEGVPDGIILNEDWDDWRKKLNLAESKGAIGLITIKENYREGADRVKIYLENPNMQMHNPGRKKSEMIPNLYISDSLAQTFLNSINESSINISIDIEEKLTSDNVLGYIEGSDLKDELVIITAHYDHLGYDNGEVCNGADDDGTGTVSVIELAQAFQIAKDGGNGPRRSMLFMTVSGEEKGLWGSKYYSENPIYPLENTVVDLNIDMIGRRDDEHDYDNYIYLIGANRISMDLHLISEQVNDKYINYDIDYTYNAKSDPNQFYYRSDHYNFAKHGIPVIFYFSGVHKDYHKPTDDVDKIDFNKVQKTAKLVFYTAWEIANRDQRLRKNGIK